MPDKLSQIGTQIAQKLLASSKNRVEKMKKLKLRGEELQEKIQNEKALQKLIN
jgi:hypothetical protein